MHEQINPELAKSMFPDTFHPDNDYFIHPTPSGMEVKVVNRLTGNVEYVHLKPDPIRDLELEDEEYEQPAPASPSTYFALVLGSLGFLVFIAGIVTAIRGL